MPKINTTPKMLRPFTSHGVILDWESREEAQGTCVFCNHEGPKFHVNVETGLWHCKRCLTKGNPTQFLQQYWELCDKKITDYSELVGDRGLLYAETLEHWGVVKSLLIDEWLIPGYGAGGTLCNLYHYQIGHKTPYGTSTFGHCMHAPYDRDKSEIYLCEGPWDGMALWEILDRGDDIGVMAMPGTGSIGLPLGRVAPLLEGKVVSICFDNDQPGLDASHRAAEILLGCKTQPKEVCYLRWGRNGLSVKLPQGYDIRDCLKQGSTKEERYQLWLELRKRVKSIPTNWTPRSAEDWLPCDNWAELIEAWKGAMRWNDGLDRALACMLAVVMSTMVVGDQLWMKIIGPASCGKSELCEAFSTNKRFTFPKSTIRGFHSGWKKGEDSLIKDVNGKTLITKDGDTLLQSPNLHQILSEARDVYDGVSRSHYRTGSGQDHENLRITWLLCGTNSLRQLDTSELGERFLDSVISEEIDEDEEDATAIYVADRAVRYMGYEASTAETREGPEKLKAKQLTGGYVNYLRLNSQSLLSAVECPTASKRLCARYAKFIALMRARPSQRQQEKAERELSYRLTTQLIRLATCLTAVLNRKTVDGLVLRRVRQVAFDTSRGRTLDIAKYLYRAGDNGIEAGVIARHTAQPVEEEKRFLRFLRQIGVADSEYEEHAYGVRSSVATWRMTNRMRTIYEEVMK